VHTTQQQQQQQQAAAMSETNLQLSLQLVELKGSLTRDFRLLVFFMDQFPQCPQVSHWGRFKFLQKFAEIVQYSQLYTGDKLFTGVNHTGNKLSQITPAIKLLDDYQSAYTWK
jgi:hypothetical protein